MQLVRLVLLTALAGIALATTRAHALPVTLEPSQDNTLYDDNGAGLLSNGKGNEIFAGKTNNQGGIVKQRAVLAFEDLDQLVLPPGATISASLTLFLTRSISGNHTISLHRLSADWGEGSSDATSRGGGGGAPAETGDATWTRRFFDTVSWTTPGGDFVGTASASQTVGSVSAPYVWTSATLGSDVADWIANPATNFGWIVIGNEATNGSAKRFGSRESAVSSERPRLHLEITTPAPLDHFLCYKAKNSAGDFKFTARNVTVADAIMADTTWELFKPISLCTPADKNGEGIADEQAHLEGYQMKEIADVTVLPPAATVNVTNQFHGSESLVVKTGKVDRLLVPTSKCVDVPAGTCPLDLAPPAVDNPVDHYACHKATVSPNGPKFTAIEHVTVDDQFINPAKKFTLKKPTRLCVAADKNGESIKRPLYNLMCYQAKKELGGPAHIKQKKLHTSNQFGHERMDTLKEDELCVPSSIIVR